MSPLIFIVPDMVLVCYWVDLTAIFHLCNHNTTCFFIRNIKFPNRFYFNGFEKNTNVKMEI